MSEDCLRLLFRSFRFVSFLDLLLPPHEPELTMNSFLEPLVKELLDLWSGVMIKTDTSTVLIRAALLCAACDIPAAVDFIVPNPPDLGGRLPMRKTCSHSHPIENSNKKSPNRATKSRVPDAQKSESPVAS